MDSDADRARLCDAEIDPKIIRRPVPGSFQQQEPRTPMAQNLYPDLKLLPINLDQLEPASPQVATSHGKSTGAYSSK